MYEKAKEMAAAAGLELRETEYGLELTDGAMALRGDFTEMLPRLKPANLKRELLVRAALGKHAGEDSLRLVDATAGMGEDSVLLAAAGFSVELYEYNPVTAALLADALARAARVPELAQTAARMRLAGGDSIPALIRMGEDPALRPDVVLLDPMFPAKQKHSLTNKKLQLLQRLERPCAAEEEILAAATAARPKKIVIKRPVKGPFLAGERPGYSITGKTVRYDCIVL